MKIYQIFRKASKALNETEDQYIAYRMSEKLAQDWIESQKNQMFAPCQYYLKIIDTNEKQAQDE